MNLWLVNLLVGDLQRWQGGETIRDHLEAILEWADSHTPKAKGVFIVDSVYDARMLADTLRQRYRGLKDVGEVHGFMSDEERDEALQCRFSVGTTTIDVGVDLVGGKAKDFLVCEARSAEQAIQRVGRLGRRGREPGTIAIMNTVWLVVPDYVYAFCKNRFPSNSETSPIERSILIDVLNMAYLDYEDFAAYTRKYSPLEAVAASERIKRQYATDSKQLNGGRLRQLVATLHRRELPATQEQVERYYKQLLRCQQAVWRKFGTPIRSTGRFFLGDLESFRGGFESEFTVAIYDERDDELGMKPLKYYNLVFTLRRTECRGLTRDAFVALLRERHPQQAEQWLEELGRQQNLLGYVHVSRLKEGKARRVYFELPQRFLDEEALKMPVRLPVSELTVNGEGLDMRSLRGINEALSRRELNCWIAARSSIALSRGQTRPLPPLFTIYPLVPISLSGKKREHEWSIAFGVNAFLLESIFTKSWWARGKRGEGGAIFC